MLGKVMVYSVLGSKNGVENSLETYFGEVADLFELGKMRYYINDEGRIAYEKVPNISWSITNALYSS